jgi:RimJ/RimL family protein N-acetyltransferase
MSLAPTLTTKRLTLRPMREGDFPAYARLMESPRAAYMGGPFDTRAAWGMFCHDAACWALFGHGALMVDQASTGETVGQVGLNAGPLFPETELGWFLYDGHEGAGYATEGAAALRDWAFRTLPVESLVSYMDAANVASQAVARRLGATLDADAPRPDPEDLVFRHRRAA